MKCLASFIFVWTTFAGIVYAEEVRHLSVMLDIDGTVCRRVSPEIAQEIGAQRLRFEITETDSAKFYRWYDRMRLQPELAKRRKLLVEKLGDESLEVEEWVLARPGIGALLEGVLALEKEGVKVRIYVTSRNDDVRTRNLINNIDLNVGGKQFGEVVEFVGREKFRVLVSDCRGGRRPAKSVALFRFAKGIAGDKRVKVAMIDDTTEEEVVYWNDGVDRLFRVEAFEPENLRGGFIREDKLRLGKLLAELRAFAVKGL